MNKRNIEKLKWFLSFISMDFEKCKTDEILKFHKDTLVFVAEGIIRAASSLSEVLKMEKKSFLKFLNEFPLEIADSDNAIKLNGYRANLITTQNELNDVFKDFFRWIESVCSEKEAGSGEFGDIKIKMHVNYGFIREEKKPDDCEGKNRTRVYVQEIVEGGLGRQISLVIVRCLSDIPLESFHRCPECNNYFINVTKKIKTYCTNKCATRFITRKTRQDQKKAQPNLYKKKLAIDAKRSRKLYEKKIKEKFPDSNITPERRPYKHKEE